MRNKKILFLILIYAMVSRFWQIDKIPPLFDPSLLSSRYLSAFLSLSSTLLVYFYALSLFKNIKLALLSSWTFTLLPWTIEQGRIYSQVNNVLPILFIFIILFNKVKKIHLKVSFFVLCFSFFVLVYPQFWLFKTYQFIPNLSTIINNFFYLLSADFLFFKNPTFWWGGVREFGILYLSFLPFLLVGIYKLVACMWCHPGLDPGSHGFILKVPTEGIPKQVQNDRKCAAFEVIIWFVFILIVASFSPFFPESREFFLATPFISILIATGVIESIQNKKINIRILIIIVLIMFLYDIGQYLHYYQIHYPQQVESSREKIGEGF